jgi:hypothetical protein
MMQVFTNVGYVDQEKLTVVDEPAQIFGNNRVIVTKWFLDGTLVRQDLMGNILSGIAAIGEQENI